MLFLIKIFQRLNNFFSRALYLLSLIFKNVFNKHLSNKKNSFDTFSSKLQAFSPLSVLSRGYTVSTKDDELLDNTKLTEGDEILTRTERNLISSKITKIDEIK